MSHSDGSEVGHDHVGTGCPQPFPVVIPRDANHEPKPVVTRALRRQDRELDQGRRAARGRITRETVGQVFAPSMAAKAGKAGRTGSIIRTNITFTR